MTRDRSIKPAVMPALKFNPPELERIRLENGLDVYFLFKDKLPLVRVNMLVGAGSKFDPGDKKGLAYLTSMVIDEGADDLNALQLSDEFDLLGTQFNVLADNDSVNFSLQSLSENFARSLELFSKVLLRPHFGSDDFEREKKKLLTRILQSRDEPEYLADQIFDMIISGEGNIYAFPVMGYEESVQSIEISDLRSHYNDLFSPGNSFLVIAGNISREELIGILERFLGSWRTGIHVRHPSPAGKIQKRKLFLHHKEGSVQTEIRAGHLSPKRDNQNYFRKLLLNMVLGGQFTSRINLNLRERNGYTYGAHSRFQYFKDSGFFQVSTSVGIENTANAVNEILFEMDNIKKGVTQDELEFAKSSITKKYPLNFETYRQIVSNVSSKIFYGLPDDYFSTYIDNVNSVSKEDVDKAALEFIECGSASVVLVGDRNRLAGELKKTGLEICEVDHKGRLME